MSESRPNRVIKIMIHTFCLRACVSQNRVVGSLFQYVNKTRAKQKCFSYLRLGTEKLFHRRREQRKKKKKSGIRRRSRT